MSEKQALIAALKQQLKAHGKTYADVGSYIGLSEASIKRLLSKGDISLARLEQLCEMIDMQLSELVMAMQAQKQRLVQLTLAQEKELVNDDMCLLIAGCVMNHWTVDDILEHYAISLDDLIKRLVHLDRIKFIELLPNNRYKILISRDFRWIPQGPIQQYFQQHAQADFLNCDFGKKHELFTLQFGMLTEESCLYIQKKCMALAKELSVQHVEEISVPLNKKRNMTLVMAMRPWLPPFSKRYRKDKQHGYEW